MVTEKQRADWQALVDYLTPKGNGACLNVLLEDGPDNTTDFAGLLRTFKRRDSKPCKECRGVGFHKMDCSRANP
jgi:hypothetical protein